MSLLLEIYLLFLIMGVCSLAQICLGSRYQPCARTLSLSDSSSHLFVPKFSLYYSQVQQWTVCRPQEGFAVVKQSIDVSKTKQWFFLEEEEMLLSHQSQLA